MSTYPEPENEIVAEILALLNESQHEEFEERAGIIQHDGQFQKGHAECLALLLLLLRHRLLAIPSKE